MVPAYNLCDLCAAQTSRLTQHLEILIGDERDEVDGHTIDVKKPIDLCGPCAIKALNWFVTKFGSTVRDHVMTRGIALYEYIQVEQEK